MAKKYKAKNLKELTDLLELTNADKAEIEIRNVLNTKIIKVAEKSGLTHVEMAKLAGTSRSRLTAILNRNMQGVSTDLLLRILGALGYKAKISFAKAG